MIRKRRKFLASKKFWSKIQQVENYDQRTVKRRAQDPQRIGVHCRKEPVNTLDVEQHYNPRVSWQLPVPRITTMRKVLAKRTPRELMRHLRNA